MLEGFLNVGRFMLFNEGKVTGVLYREKGLDMCKGAIFPIYLFICGHSFVSVYLLCLYAHTDERNNAHVHLWVHTTPTHNHA